MLRLLSRARRHVERRPFVRRPSLELLEARNAPTALDPTTTLFPPDPVPGPPALTDPSAGNDIVAAPLPSGDTTTDPTPQPVTNSFLAVVTAPTVPPGPTTGGGTTGSDPDGSGGTGGAGSPAGPPAIADIGAVVNDNLTCTVSGNVCALNPSGYTVKFDGWVMTGLQAPVQTNGTFSITFEVPPCDGVASANHTCTAVATDGHGNDSPQVTFTISQTPPLTN